MRATTLGLSALVAGYVLSQFYRAFLAVLAPTLESEIGASPGDLAISSGLWFLTFAAMQLPIGWALDAIGPRRTCVVLLGLGGGGGAMLFAAATAPWHLHIAMALIGVGCAPVLMSAYFVIARIWPIERFGALAGITVAVGSAGNILGAAPLVHLVEAAGWRSTLWGLAAITLLVAGLIAILVPDPPPEPQPAHAQGALAQLLHLRSLWWLLPLVFVSYAASAGIRGVWAGPFLQEVHGADARVIGRATLVMGLGMIAGNFLVGPAIRLARGARRAAAWAGAGTCLALAGLAFAPQAPMPVTVLLLGVIGMSGANYAILMTHGRSFLPPHLLGYGITFLNMVSITGVGILQFASRPVYNLPASDPAETFSRLFLTFLIPLAVGLALYMRGPDAPACR